MSFSNGGKGKGIQHQNSRLIEVKSKFEAEFRRFSFDRKQDQTFDEFMTFLRTLHHLPEDSVFCCYYVDPKDRELLPITNQDNFKYAIKSCSVLRLVLQKDLINRSYYDKSGKSKLIVSPERKKLGEVSGPADFRRVAAIVDVDVLPGTLRRVKLVKTTKDKALGLFIRDGNSLRVTEHGVEKVPGIFVSKLDQTGLAYSTGLLAVYDEIIEVNGIEVAGKNVDQVAEMMIANVHNLILTVKPANQHLTLAANRPKQAFKSHNRPLTTIQHPSTLENGGRLNDSSSSDLVPSTKKHHSNGNHLNDASNEFSMNHNVGRQNSLPDARPVRHTMPPSVPSSSQSLAEPSTIDKHATPNLHPVSEQNLPPSLDDQVRQALNDDTDSDEDNDLVKVH